MKSKLLLTVAILTVMILPILTSCINTGSTPSPAPGSAPAPGQGPAPASAPKPEPAPTFGPAPSSAPPSEVEATEFMGHKLTPISQQRNNALKGVQHIDRSTYKLTIDGLVDRPLNLTFADLQAYTQISQLMDLDCVEGWNFTAKWTGPALADLFDDAKVKPEAKIAIFHTADVPEGYSSLDLNYIYDNKIIIALKDNDITLSADRGFPFQVVAMSKFGYKWAKWITRIELSSDTSFRGYWESAGYNNDANINGPAYE